MGTEPDKSGLLIMQRISGLILSSEMLWVGCQQHTIRASFCVCESYHRCCFKGIKVGSGFKTNIYLDARNSLDEEAYIFVTFTVRSSCWHVVSLAQLMTLDKGPGFVSVIMNKVWKILFSYFFTMSRCKVSLVVSTLECKGIALEWRRNHGADFVST